MLNMLPVRLVMSMKITEKFFRYFLCSLYIFGPFYIDSLLYHTCGIPWSGISHGTCSYQYQ